MKKLKLKWKSLTVGALTIFALFLGWKLLLSPAQNADAEYEQTVATLDTIHDTIKVAGTAELVNEQKLRFNQTGKVDAVYFSDGQTVKADQIIAELDKGDLENDISQAEISLKNSQITLQNLLDGSTDAEITKAKNSVSETGNKLTIAKQNLEIEKTNYTANLEDLDNELEVAQEDFAQKKRDLETAKTNLSNTLIYENKDMDASTTAYYQKFADALSDAKGYLADVQSNLDTINRFVGIEGEYESLNDAYEQNLGVLDSSTLYDTKQKYKSVKSDYESAYAKYAETGSENLNAITDLLNVIRNLMTKDTDLLEKYYALINATTSGSNISQSEIENYKSSASNLKSEAQTKTTAIQNLINDLNNAEDVDIAQLRSNETITQKEEAVKSAELNLKKSQNTLTNLEQTIAGKKENARLSLVSAQDEVTTLENNLAEAKNDLQDMLDGEDADVIAKARNDVIQKELSLEKTKSGADKYEIIAPFDGIVRQIDYKVGDNILSDDDKYVYIENPNLLKIEILLDQIDIIKVEVGQKAEIVFDALPSKTFEGVIEEVNQTPESTSGVVSYPVNLTLNKGEEKIFSGMTATVEIITAEAENVISLSNSLITTHNDKSTVLKLVDGKPTPTEVTLGVSDDINTEIVSGVSEGDVILSKAKTTSGSSSTTSTKTSSFGGGGFPRM